MTATHRPARVSAGLSVLVAAVATLFVARAPAQRQALLIALVGLGCLAAGLRLARTDHRLVAGLLGLTGVAIVAVGFWLGRTRITGVTLRAEFFPVIPALTLLVLGVGSVRAGWERWFLAAGTGGVLLTVFLSGIVYGAPGQSLLAATAATVVAWDLGEQAINLGEQVGTDARTWPVELTHGAVSLGIGICAVVAAQAVYGLGVSGVSLGGLAVLLGAAVVLTTALFN